MKYLRCKCCNFLAVIPKQDNHEGLICPFCYRQKCSDGKFEIINIKKFLKESKLSEKKVICLNCWVEFKIGAKSGNFPSQLKNKIKKDENIINE